MGREFSARLLVGRRQNLLLWLVEGLGAVYSVVVGGWIYTGIVAGVDRFGFGGGFTHGYSVPRLGPTHSRPGGGRCAVIVTPREPFVALSAETCAWLEANVAGMRAARVRARGLNPKVAQELLDLREVALGWQLPEAEAVEPEAVPPLKEWLSSGDVAELEGISDSAVRLACRQGRIPDAEQVRGRWQIPRSAFNDFSAARAAG